jgi:hypothetical protein
MTTSRQHVVCPADRAAAVAGLRAAVVALAAAVAGPRGGGGGAGSGGLSFSEDCIGFNWNNVPRLPSWVASGKLLTVRSR